MMRVNPNFRCRGRAVLFAVLLLSTAAISTLAEDPSALRGRVLDPSGSPVPNARVSLIERDTQIRGTVTSDNNGRYEFPSLRRGEYLLEAQAEGLGTAEVKSLRFESAVELDLTLEIARIATQVQVTAASIAQTIDEQSKALDVLDANQLEKRAEFSVGEALRTTPGVRVMQLGGPGTFSRVIIRGTRASDTSVLVDGIRLRDAASPQGDVSSFIGDLQLVNTERIEVLRGSGSSLYGTNATGGVVNIITDQGGGRLRGDLSLEGGGLGLLRGAARFSGAALRDRFRFAGGTTRLNVSDGIDGDDKARNTTVHSYGQFQLTPMTVLSGRILASESFSALNDSPASAPDTSLPPGDIVHGVPNVTFSPSLNDPDQRRWAETLTSLVGISHNWTPRISTRVNYALVTTSRDNRDGLLGMRFEPTFPDQNIFDGRIDTVQARTDIQLNRSHLLTGGYEFERESFDNISRDQNPDPAQRVDARLRITQRSHAAFAQMQGRYLDNRLQLLFSGRWQRFGLDQPRFSDNSPLYREVPITTPPDARTGDFSASYMMAGTNTKIRAHVGNGYRAPALFERFGASFFFGSFSNYGDPRLHPERVLAFDGGFDQYFANSRVRTSATYFYTRIQEAIIFDFSGFIVPATDPYSRFGGYRNTGGGLSRGLELSLEANPVRTLTLRGSYTHTNSDDRHSQYSNSILRSIRVSDHMFTATASQRLGKWIDVTFDLFAASDYLVPLGSRAFEFDGPVKADLVGSYTRPFGDRHSLRFYTRIENVLNRRYYEEGFATPKAWAVAGVKWMF